MVVDGRGSVRSILPTHDLPTIRKHPANITGHPPARQRARHMHPHSGRAPVSYCYSDPSTARPRDSGCHLGARECGCSGRRACGLREPRGLPKAYRWKCGRTGVREAGREVIVVATGITCGMMRWSADTYKCALRVQVADGGYTPPVLLHVLLLR